MEQNTINLEQKIREALPRLKEISAGLNFIDELGFKAKIVHINNGIYFYFSESDNEILSVDFAFFNIICKEIIGHDIKLNDVLEYLNTKTIPIYNTTQTNNIAFGIFPNIPFWNLESVYLKDQSDELKQFLNEL